MNYSDLRSKISNLEHSKDFSRFVVEAVDMDIAEGLASKNISTEQAEYLSWLLHCTKYEAELWRNIEQLEYDCDARRWKKNGFKRKDLYDYIGKHAALTLGGIHFALQCNLLSTWVYDDLMSRLYHVKEQAYDQEWPGDPDDDDDCTTLERRP